MSRIVALPIICGTLLFVTGFSLITSAQVGKQGIHHNSSPSMMTMPMVAPLFIENGEFSSTLYMVNGLTIPATAKLILFDLNGNTIAEHEVKFEPDSERHLPIRQLLEQAGTSTTLGSLRVEPLTDHGMGVLTQLAITHHGPRDDYFDEELTRPDLRCFGPSRTLMGRLS